MIPNSGSIIVGVEKSGRRRTSEVPRAGERLQVSAFFTSSLFPSLLCVSSEERVRKGAEKLQKHMNSKQQGRLDGFFTVKPKPEDSPKKGKGKGKDEEKGKGKGTKRKVCLLRCSVFLG